MEAPAPATQAPIQAPPPVNVPGPAPAPPPPPPKPNPAPEPAPAPVPEPALAPAPGPNAEQPDTTPVMVPMMLLYAVAAFAYSVAFKKAANALQTSPDGDGILMFDQTVDQPRQIVPVTAKDQKDMATGAAMNKAALDGAMEAENLTVEQIQDIETTGQLTPDDLPD